MNEFAKAFRKYRVEREITLREISELTGKPIGFWSDVEHGRRLPPTKDIVEKVETLFGIKDKRLCDSANAVRQTPNNFNYLMKTNPQVASLAQTLLNAESEYGNEVLNKMLEEMHKVTHQSEDK